MYTKIARDIAVETLKAKAATLIPNSLIGEYTAVYLGTFDELDEISQTISMLVCVRACTLRDTSKQKLAEYIPYIQLNDLEILLGTTRTTQSKNNSKNSQIKKRQIRRKMNRQPVVLVDVRTLCSKNAQLSIRLFFLSISHFLFALCGHFSLVV